MTKCVSVKNKYKKQSIKFNSFMGFLIAVVMVCIFSLYLNDYFYTKLGNFSDQLYYQLHYEGKSDTSYFEVGYSFLTKLFYSLGFSYKAFKFIMGSISALLIFSRIGKFQINYILLLALYFITAYVWDLEQSRYFFATSILIYATKFFPLKTNQSRIKYLLLILIATSIHKSMILFLFALLFSNKTVWRNRKTLLIFVFVVCLFFKLFPQLLSALGSVLYSLTKSDRILMWLSFHTNNGFYLCFAINGFFFVCMEFMIKKMQKYINLFSKDEVDFISEMYFLIYVLMITIPTYLFALEFVRMIRGVFILFFAAILIVYSKRKSKQLLKSDKLYISVLNIGQILFAVFFLFFFSGILLIPEILNVII